MLAGCVNLAPEYERPEAPVAQAWPTGEAYEAAQLKAEQLPSWNEFFVNESLREVIRLGLETTAVSSPLRTRSSRCARSTACSAPNSSRP